VSEQKEPKAIDLKGVTMCAQCHGPLTGPVSTGKTGNFYRVTLENCFPNINAIRQHAGLTIMLGAAALADVFAPDRRAAFVISEDGWLLCFRCVPTSLLSLMERKADEERDQEETPVEDEPA
jgi:hypothetical protein